jgi:NAD(P)-dependent dehydrogenase (short-subunit alcohol dehydrogenase family)
MTDGLDFSFTLPTTMTFDAAATVASAHLTTPKTAALVGATTGIGAATARTFASVGIARILIVGRDGARAEAVLQECRDAAAAAEGVQGDLATRFVPADLSTRAGAIQCARDLADAADGRIDFLVSPRWRR